jgi:hypothetical protein
LSYAAPFELRRTYIFLTLLFV